MQNEMIIQKQLKNKTLINKQKWRGYTLKKKTMYLFSLRFYFDNFCMVMKSSGEE